MPTPQDPNRPMQTPPQSPEGTPVEAPQRSTPRKEELNPQGKKHGDSCGC